MKKRITFPEARDLLVKYEQPDVLLGYDKLSPGERVKLLHQIANMDWETVNIIRAGAKKEPLGSLSQGDTLGVDQIEGQKENFKKRGQFLIRAGKVGVVMLAGGPGEKSGIGKPKGELNLGNTRVLYVYQCLVERLLELSVINRATIPLYIMTIEDYREQAEQFFLDHKYFGYPKELVTFFNQDNSLCLDFEGNVFFDGTGHLACNPDGDGGWFKSMADSDLIYDLDRRGIEWLNVFSVNNPLQHMADPAFIGAVVLGGYDAGAKAVRKINVFEKIGIYCHVDDRPAVLEYHELDDVTKGHRDEFGELTFGFGVTFNYLFSVKKLKSILDVRFPTHFKKAKIPYVDEEGFIVTPKEPNGYRFEIKSSDVVSMMDKCLCYEVIRAREYAPIKNATGPDSLETAKILLEDLGVRL